MGGDAEAQSDSAMPYLPYQAFLPQTGCWPYGLSLGKGEGWTGGAGAH